MELLFNTASRPVGWLEDNTAFSRKGRPLAFIDRGAVFSVKGCYLGRFAHGIFRDRLGCIVAFPRNVWWARVPAAFQSNWTPPVPAQAVPMHPQREPLPARPAMPSLRNSMLSWERYLLGCEAKPVGRTRA